MQNQKITSLNTQAETQGPVEIDAADLHRIGGGLPKGTWGPAQGTATAAATTSATGDEGSDRSDLPKGTW